MGKIRLIASTTYQEAVRQPIFWVLSLSFAALILLSKLTTLFAFEEEGRMIREMAIASMVLCGALVAIMTSGTLITSEIERKTALMVLSKPVRKEHFLLGKYLGILRTNASAFLLLTAALVPTLWWAEGREFFEDSMRAGKLSPEEILRVYVFGQLLPSLGSALLGFFEVAVLTAVSVIVAFHFPLVVNGTVCLGVFLLGHLSRYLCDSLSSPALGPLARGAGKVLYLLLPTLDFYNLSDYVAGGGRLSLGYLGLSLLYTALYTTLLLAIGASLLVRKEIQ